MPSFNPLHCGAVVASHWVYPMCRRFFESFNPLHCGAVVASFPEIMPEESLASLVSIPFIAGQWSLRWFNLERRGKCSLFQSPSLRGSGRFSPPRDKTSRGGPRFNPLHCGAVVASRETLGGARQRRAGFNPLHCGAVVASALSGANNEIL